MAVVAVVLYQGRVLPGGKETGRRVRTLRTYWRIMALGLASASNDVFVYLYTAREERWEVQDVRVLHDGVMCERASCRSIVRSTHACTVDFYGLPGSIAYSVTRHLLALSTPAYGQGQEQE